MIKLKKQVARLKINHLLNRNRYILFYPSSTILGPYNSLSYNLTKEIKKQSNTKVSTTLKSEGKKLNVCTLTTFLDNGILDRDLDGYNITGLFVKNKIAQKAIRFFQARLAPDVNKNTSFSHSCETFKYNAFFGKVSTGEQEWKSGTESQNIDFLYGDKNTCNKKCGEQGSFVYISGRNTNVSSDTIANSTSIDITTPQPFTHNQNLTSIGCQAHKGDSRRVFENTAGITYSGVFQGNFFFLGCNNLTTLQKILKTYSQPIGGLYNNHILDHFQVQRLAELGNEKQLYKQFISYIKMPSINILLSIKNGSSLFFLLVRQVQLLRILQIRSNQLSASRKVVGV